MRVRQSQEVGTSVSAANTPDWRGSDDDFFAQFGSNQGGLEFALPLRVKGLKCGTGGSEQGAGEAGTEPSKQRDNDFLFLFLFLIL